MGRITMLCEFTKLLYPRDARSVMPGSFMIALYRPCERIMDSGGHLLEQVKAVGYCLPIAEDLRYDMHGKWCKSAKHGMQYEVETYDGVVAPTKNGIVAYLSSGQVKGIGKVLAERIYDAFGENALEVLDKEPEKLLTISGISESKLKKITESYLANRAARDVVAFFIPYGITANRAVKLYKEYKNRTMEIVKNHPYQLCEMAGVGFSTADKIAKSMGFTDLSTERVDAALLYTLTEAETCGHVCMDKHKFIRSCLKLLQTSGLTEEMVANRAVRLIHSHQLVCYQDMVYRTETDAAENSLAHLISGHIEDISKGCVFDLDKEIDETEKSLGLTFAAEQREAIKTALTNSLSIITGGPGTGKTMIQKALLKIYRRIHPFASVCCCAPTGRAARRLEQSTGFPASTIHKALGLYASEDGKYSDAQNIDADLVLVDEVSMLDTYLAGKLFKSIDAGTQIVLIGDADQLPSVGPGAVLSEMILSSCVPVVRLDKVFRQKNGSRIAINAKLIRHGNVGLEYGEDFRFIDSPDIAQSAKTIGELFAEEVDKYGLDNVALLTPYRQKTETGVNALNVLLQETINPPDASKPQAMFGKKLFRVGDKVMQVKNHEDVNNGDVGYIRKILGDGGDMSVYVDFGDGRIKEYDSADLEMLDLGYASTVHKSQGSEYNSVIINLQCAHSVMLTRPLIYTAITRGKDNVIIVGERRALCIAIKRTDTERRGTCLAKRLKEIQNQT